MTVARRIALLHPGLVTATLILTSLAPQIATASRSPSLSSLDVAVWAAVVLTPMSGWAWAVYATANARRGPDGAPAWTPWLFAAAPLLAFIVKIFTPVYGKSPIEFLIMGVLALGLWRAAEALEQADPAKAGPPTTGRILATMALLFFSPVGCWVLRQKIVRVAQLSAA